MHLKLGIILMALLIGFNSMQALLPPLYHTLAEFKAIVDDKMLLDKLESGEAIVSITRLDDGNFEVLTTKNKLSIEVVFDKTKLIGPGKFHLVIQDPQPR